MSEIDLSQLVGPAAELAVELIKDVIAAVAAGREHDHDALISRLAAARDALAGASADARLARAEGAAALKALDEESPKARPVGDEESPK